jgi:hypothetical protein
MVLKLMGFKVACNRENECIKHERETRFKLLALNFMRIAYRHKDIDVKKFHRPTQYKKIEIKYST